MNGNFGHLSQPVFMVDSGGGQARQNRYYHQQMPRHSEPQLVPCWTFPPARAEMKRRGCGGMNAGMVWVLILILLLVFAALGLGAYQILRLQNEVQLLSQWQAEHSQMQSSAPQKQVGLNPAWEQEQPNNRNKQKSAAHLIGRADQNPSSGVLKWELKLGQAFTEGVKYIDGGLQVNETGLYFVYSRVEFLLQKCQPEDYFVHKMRLQRNNHNRTIMEDHRQGFCSVGSNQPLVTGSHIGSLQHLKPFDRLFVNVSGHPLQLSKNFHGNYFGLFKIH